jgi:hypothetical protein
MVIIVFESLQLNAFRNDPGPLSAPLLTTSEQDEVIITGLWFSLSDRHNPDDEMLDKDCPIKLFGFTLPGGLDVPE